MTPTDSVARTCFVEPGTGYLHGRRAVAAIVHASADESEHMPGVTIETTATPAQVWSILSNGWMYSSWVVGASRIRDVDPTWPQAGSRIHHSVGVWPALLDDETESVHSSAGRLELTARGRPMGSARVVVTVEKSPTGSRVTMDEHALSAPERWVPNQVQRLVVAPRLRECLRRLALLAENGAR